MNNIPILEATGYLEETLTLWEIVHSFGCLLTIDALNIFRIINYSGESQREGSSLIGHLLRAGGDGGCVKQNCQNQVEGKGKEQKEKYQLLFILSWEYLEVHPQAPSNDKEQNQEPRCMGGDPASLDHQ